MVKKTIKKDLVRADLNDERWINTPFAFSKFGANFSLLQQDIMFAVSKHLQSYIKQFFIEHREQSKETPNPLFSANDIAMGIPSFKINFQDLGVFTSNYGDIKSSIDEIWNLSLKIPTESGGMTDWIHVFSKFSIPNTLNGYHRETADGVLASFDRSKGYIEVRINPDVAKFVFDMSKGYINHLALIARYSTKRSTPRLYLYLMRCVAQNQMVVRAKVEELKEYLGLYEKNEETGEKKYQYVKFAHFRTRVLDMVKADLERMSDLNQSEIVFNYKAVYKNGVTTGRGDPLYIKFSISRSNLGKARNIIQHRSASEAKFIGAMVKKCPDLKAVQLKNVLSQIPNDTITAFLEYGYKGVWRQVEKTQPDDAAAYVLSLLKAWSNDTPVPGSPHAAKGQQLSLFPSATDRERWTYCVQALCSAVDADTMSATFARLRFSSFTPSRHLLILGVDNKKTVDKIEGELLEVYSKNIRKFFGNNVTVKYKIL